MQEERKDLDLTLTTYVTPGPEIFSLECSHPRDGLFTSPPVPPRLHPSPPPGWDSSILHFFPELTKPGSSGAWGAEDEPGLPDPPPDAPPWSLDTARSFTADGRPLMPSRPEELANLRLETLLMRVHKVPDSSEGSGSAGGAYGGSPTGGDGGTAETLAFMERPCRSSSTDVTDSFRNRLYLARWSIPLGMPAYTRTDTSNSQLTVHIFCILELRKRPRRGLKKGSGWSSGKSDATQQQLRDQK